ncbi:MAG: D-tyrosyl-tRNA(Tyr) deacylase [Akkermansiaceae bacterium]|jgi:D-tyrosyl-tRNA(Tyr) deacylase
MRIVLQRVSQASVTVEQVMISAIKTGFLILLGIEEADGPEDVDWLVGKIVKMRIFEDDNGKMNLSLLDLNADALVASQFTLHASTQKGNRPSFMKAARPDHAEPLYETFCEKLSHELARPVGRGSFGAMMQISLINDGPVTITMDSRDRQ